MPAKSDAQLPPSTQDKPPETSVFMRQDGAPSGTGSALPDVHSERTPTALTESGTVAEATPKSSMRLWLGVAAGLAVTGPLAWLLSYGAALPFFLGIFFFALFGIIIGAVVHRVAAGGRPYGRWTLVLGTTVIVLGGWTFTIVKEGREMPAEMAGKAVRQTRDIGDLSTREFQESVDRQIREYLQVHYPPGGALGYVLWVLDDGVLGKDVIDGVTVPLVASQRRYGWAIRVLLSVGLLAFGVGSQVLLLRLPNDPPVRTRDVRPNAVHG